MSQLPQAYNEIAISTEIASASPHRLVQLLLEGALQHIRLTKTALTNKEPYQKKYLHLNRARDICEYLRLSLNNEREECKGLAKLLSTLYTRCEKNLINTALKNDTSYLDESILILSNIKEGWDNVTDKVGEPHV